MAHTRRLKLAAKKLYLSGLSIDDIAHELKISVDTLYRWRRKFAWQDELRFTDEEVIAIRIKNLADKNIKT
ncbi:MAG: helix-turn-helix domain-containing protein [Methylococcaceae bacterium]